ncbi:protein kinase, putative [Trypanosoma brucei gambiense DAL972]|uniref:Protein kinase, putative n=1 Tax=Trypanosoma brucei gambiense (strain MHOM/CI/86/DAL972) TaxID=679716 RepID=C9ZJF3_TRYB9|nr:protein kinase, putative [Trypanosoma brucei gambiense DAL972]CBH09512.1 protein kinase, putative [Trypanosoma brucei gambiense DAL972]|eukprot:XP_011771817.1 protein kinase, putative [Trypanosoma brucei gambiense DAL972]
MAELLRKKIEALKSRKAAAEEPVVTPQSSSTTAALAPSSSLPSSSTTVTAAAPAQVKSTCSVPLANLPPAFVSPYTAVVKYRDTVKDPLCAQFTTSVAVELFKTFIQQRHRGNVSVHAQKRARSEDFGATERPVRSKGDNDSAKNEEEVQQQREEGYQHQHHNNSSGEGESLSGVGSGGDGINKNIVHFTHPPLCTVVSYFLPYLEARCFTHSDVKDREGKTTWASEAPDVPSLLQGYATSLHKNVKSSVKAIRVSGKTRPPCRSVNEYVPVGQIAHGVYGVVYRATEANGSSSSGGGRGRKFALKQVKQRWLEESEVGFPPYLLREFDLLLRLRHPNIVCGREVVLLDKKSNSSKASKQQEVKPATGTTGREVSNEVGRHNHRTDNVQKTKEEPTASGNDDGLPSSCNQGGDKKEEEPPQIKTKLSADKMKDVYLVMEYCPYDLKAFIYHRKGVAALLHLSSANKHPDAPRCFLSRVKCVMQQLFTGVAFLHDHRILHRDIKTSNILISSTGEVKLCDFGLGRHYREGQELTANVVTLMYRAPELHFGITDYSYKMDMWSLGCIMAEIFLKEPLFRAEEESRHFAVICDVIGIPTEETFSGLYKMHEVTRLMRSLKRYNRENTLQQIFSRSNHSGAATLPPSGMDLLNRILRWNPIDRLSAREALEHKFFHEDPLPCMPEELLAPLPTTVAEEQMVGVPSQREGGAAVVAGKSSSETNCAIPQALESCEGGDNEETCGFGETVRSNAESPTADVLRARASNIDEEVEVEVRRR